MDERTNGHGTNGQRTYLGVISKYIESRGFGFIAIDGERRQIFFHITRTDPAVLLGETPVNKRVAFGIERDAVTGRPMAVDVRLLEGQQELGADASKQGGA